MCATNSFREGRTGCSTMGTTRVGNHGVYLYSFAFDTTARKQAAHSQLALAHCTLNSKCVTVNVCR